MPAGGVRPGPGLAEHVPQRWPGPCSTSTWTPSTSRSSCRSAPGAPGRPVVVGGAGRRGVVAAASYEARAYGVHSAMPSVRARRLCPQAVFLPASFERYDAASRKVMALFADVTPLVEPLSLDEAFLDVTAAQRRAGPPGGIAADLRRPRGRGGGPAVLGRVWRRRSSWPSWRRRPPSRQRRRPVRCPAPGCSSWRRGEELRFLHPLPLQALWGVGPATLAPPRAPRRGLGRRAGGAARGGGDRRAGRRGRAGTSGRWPTAWTIGRWSRTGPSSRSATRRRSPHDLHERDRCERELVRLADAVGGRLRRHGLAGRTVTLKLRYGDFRTLTRSRTSPDPARRRHGDRPGGTTRCSPRSTSPRASGSSA